MSGSPMWGKSPDWPTRAHTKCLYYWWSTYRKKRKKEIDWVIFSHRQLFLQLQNETPHIIIYVIYSVTGIYFNKKYIHLCNHGSRHVPFKVRISATMSFPNKELTVCAQRKYFDNPWICLLQYIYITVYLHGVWYISNVSPWHKQYIFWCTLHTSA